MKSKFILFSPWLLKRPVETYLNYSVQQVDKTLTAKHSKSPSSRVGEVNLNPKP